MNSREQLLADAVVAGYGVTAVGNLTQIHRPGAGRVEGIFIYPDETAHVMWASKRLRTYEAMRQALGLPRRRNDARRQTAGDATQEIAGR